jgi:hypothetical protein
MSNPVISAVLLGFAAVGGVFAFAAALLASTEMLERRLDAPTGPPNTSAETAAALQTDGRVPVGTRAA